MLRTIYHDAVVSVQVMKNADNETLTGVGVDMLGYDGVCFIASALKGEALDFAIKAQQAAVSDYSDAADLAGTSVTFSTTVGADAVAVLEIHNPLERYVRPIVTVPNATAATATSCIAIKYRGKTRPESAPTYGELHVGPAEGTA